MYFLQYLKNFYILLIFSAKKFVILNILYIFATTKVNLTVVVLILSFSLFKLLTLLY